MLDMCFRPGLTRKELELFQMHTCLWPGAQVWFRRKWSKLVTAFPSLRCIDRCECFRYLNEVFYAVFRFLDWSFLVLHFDGNVCHWIRKVIWPWTEWLWGFCSKMASFVDFISLRTEIGSSCWIVIFLKTSIFSMFSLRGVLVCCLKTILLFSRRIFPDRLKSLRKAIQFSFLSLCVYQLFFREVW